MLSEEDIKIIVLLMLNDIVAETKAKETTMTMKAI
jgi:hypothetical protein